jgi:hypothetical protein
MLHMQACVNTYSYTLLHAYFVLAFYRNAGALFHEDEYIQGDTHTYVSTRARASFLCGAKMLHRQLRDLIAASLLSKTVASTTYLHTPFSAPKTYMCICASLWLKNKSISAQTPPTYACLHVWRAARLQEKMHSIISQAVRVQYSSHTYWDIWFVCVCVCVWSDLIERERESLSHK